MNNDFKLELKAKNAQDEKDVTFYRYRYETCKIWFSQNQLTGDIYRVNIVDEEYPDVEYYSYDTEDRFYPTDVTVIIPRSIVKNDNDYTALNKKVRDCCLRRSAIKKFLLSSEHYKLWLEKHGEN